MISLQQVQVNIVLSILLMVLLVHANLNMNKRKITNRLFIWIMGLICFTLILEIFSVLLNNPNLKRFIAVHKLVNIIGFIVTPIIPFLGYIFIKEWINRYEKEKIRANKILILPLVINGIAALISYKGIGLFHITSENIYERGPLFFILPCVSFIYFVYNLYFIYKERKKLTYLEFITFNLFYIVPAVFTSVQLKYSTYLTTWNSAAIIIVIAYIFILNDLVYRDSLTGLQNRLAYEHYAQNISSKKLNKLFIIYIDLDDLKSINDQYGHCEGDEAIKTFAHLLVPSFPLRQRKLIRLGGDEFLILLEEQDKKKVEGCMKNLTKRVEAYNNKEKKLYRLSFSYGMARYTKSYENIGQLLEYTDILMYEQKRSKNSKSQGKKVSY